MTLTTLCGGSPARTRPLDPRHRGQAVLAGEGVAERRRATGHPGGRGSDVGDLGQDLRGGVPAATTTTRRPRTPRGPRYQAECQLPDRRSQRRRGRSASQGRRQVPVALITARAAHSARPRKPEPVSRTRGTVSTRTGRSTGSALQHSYAGEVSQATTSATEPAPRPESAVLSASVAAFGRTEQLAGRSKMPCTLAMVSVLGRSATHRRAAGRRPAPRTRCRAPTRPAAGGTRWTGPPAQRRSPPRRPRAELSSPPGCPRPVQPAEQPKPCPPWDRAEVSPGSAGMRGHCWCCPGFAQ